MACGRMSSPLGLPPAPSLDSSAELKPRSGGGVSLGVAVVLLVLSGIGFFLASTFDLLLAGGSSGESFAIVAVGWVLTLALWISGIVLTVVRHRRKRGSWLPALLAGGLMGAVQIGTWSIALELSR